jgi:hypothetical protein
MVREGSIRHTYGNQFIDGITSGETWEADTQVEKNKKDTTKKGIYH